MPLSDIMTIANQSAEASAEAEERRKKIMAATRVGSPGKLSTLMGYMENATDNNR